MIDEKKVLTVIHEHKAKYHDEYTALCHLADDLKDNGIETYTNSEYYCLRLFLIDNSGYIRMVSFKYVDNSNSYVFVTANESYRVNTPLER